MVTAYFVLAGASVLLWVPILLKFYRAWINRHNPVSLAICALVLVLIWFAGAGAWLVTKSVSSCMLVLVMVSISSAVAVFSHLAFYWAKRHFTDSRDE